MAKRNKINNEDPKLNFRLPEELRNLVINNANLRGITVSSYMREMLEKVLILDHDKANIKSKTIGVIGSLDFLKLIIWLYKKRERNGRTEEIEELDFYISVIKRLDGVLPKELNDEFDKVLANLVAERKKVHGSNGSYEFLKSYSDYGAFDYKKMEKYLLEVGLEIA